MTAFQFFWILAGVILGWISVEALSAATKTYMPYIFNFAMAFVGALVAYTLVR